MKKLQIEGQEILNRGLSAGLIRQKQRERSGEDQKSTRDIDEHSSCEVSVQSNDRRL